MVIFKYSDFLLDNLNVILGAVGFEVIPPVFDVLLPVGISFYTFQALSYTMDVYRGDVAAEKNFFRYALFVSFFPQLVAGPIERSTNLLRQINSVSNRRNIGGKQIVQGLEMMLWGFYLKVVIADRIAVLVKTVYDQYYLYSSFALVIAAISFSIQIYCDFSGYTVIAIGAAKVLGFELMENFNTPYLSRSIKEFWHRWHISLSTWFKDYLYIPLGGGHCGKWRKYFNTMLTFLISGLWHGANWTYIIWGGINGLYQIIGEELQPARKKLNRYFGIKTENFSYRFGQAVVTFCFVNIAWIFFRSDSVRDAFYYIYRICTKIDLWSFFDGTIYTLGLDVTEIHILIVSIVILFLVDLHKYKTQEGIEEFLDKQNLWFHWGVVIIGICAILVYGIYGAAFDPQQFIYFQF